MTCCSVVFVHASASLVYYLEPTHAFNNCKINWFIYKL